MRILVADDDKVARKVLDTFLRQSKHEVEIVEDGASALRVMSSDRAPHVAIFDWIMPDISGPELCRRLRAQPWEIEPYLIILSSKREKNEIAQALDAGADDFLTKPFNIVETQARLRVAERAIARQLSLHRKVAEARAELQQHVDLFEPSDPAAADPAVEDTLSGFAPLAAAEVEPLLLHVLQTEISPAVAIAQPPTETDAPPGTVLAWSGTLLPREHLWIDVLLETGSAAPAGLFELARGLPPASPAELTDFCGALQGALCDALRSRLQAARTEHFAPFDLVHPGGTASPYLRNLIHRRGRTHHFSVTGQRLSVTLVATPSPSLTKRPDQLRVFDLLGEPYPPMESNEIMIMPEGFLLTERHIERLGRFADGRADVPPVLVHRPSSLAMHYNRHRRKSAGP